MPGSTMSFEVKLFLSIEDNRLNLTLLTQFFLGIRLILVDNDLSLMYFLII